MENDFLDDTLTASFKTKTIKELLKLGFADPDRTKINKEALTLVAKVLQIFVAECAMRSASQAQITADKTVLIDHLEKILPQLLFDF